MAEEAPKIEETTQQGILILHICIKLLRQKDINM